MSIETVLVTGAGAMGSQIAMVAALSGCTVGLYDVDQATLDRAVEQLALRMTAQVAKGRRTAEATRAALSRLTIATVLDEHAADVDLVIEAIVEKLPAKRDLFARLDDLCPPRTILASNSSSFVPSAMATATARADRFLNLHFFNPALVMRCVEVVRGPDTSDDAVRTALEFVEQIGKTPVVLDREIPGFVANRLLGAVRDEAIRLLEGGYADVAAIDTAARTALGYPMGPFELMDLTGIDIGYLTKTARYEETGDPADAPSATVTALVERGDLGRKTGRGFYVYDDDGNRTATTDLASLKGTH
ncbi:3-hydroxyacyl-CoA dehydrogenase family protein [Nocardioides sp.]|uniref:3-hydroxyacyl-CoA dehydrogenase family protein n=1 Tax=Nocardioides sp. TaxID=35761 RepID=UPI002EDA3923